MSINQIRILHTDSLSYLLYFLRHCILFCTTYVTNVGMSRQLGIKSKARSHPRPQLQPQQGFFFFFHHHYLLRNVESYPRAVSISFSVENYVEEAGGACCFLSEIFFFYLEGKKKSCWLATWEMSQRTFWATAELLGLPARRQERLFLKQTTLIHFCKWRRRPQDDCTPYYVRVPSDRSNSRIGVGGRWGVGTTAGSDNTQQQFVAVHNGLAPAQSVFARPPSKAAWISYLVYELLIIQSENSRLWNQKPHEPCRV